MRDARPRSTPRRAPRSMIKLTDKQRLFVFEYLKDHNGTQAAIRAGYSKTTAAQQATRLLRNAHVKAEVAKHVEKAAKKVDLTLPMVLEELALIGFANMGDYFRVTSDGDPVIDLAQLTHEQKAAIADLTVEDFTDGRGDDARNVRRVRFKLHDKRAALVDLGKHLGMGGGKHEIDMTLRAPRPDLQALSRSELLELEELCTRLEQVMTATEQGEAEEKD
jgi:phage terminase small subunit